MQLIRFGNVTSPTAKEDRSEQEQCSLYFISLPVSIGEFLPPFNIPASRITASNENVSDKRSHPVLAETIKEIMLCTNLIEEESKLPFRFTNPFAETVCSFPHEKSNFSLPLCAFIGQSSSYQGFTCSRRTIKQTAPEDKWINIVITISLFLVRCRKYLSPTWHKCQ